MRRLAVGALLLVAMCFAAASGGAVASHPIYGYGTYRITGYFPTGYATASGCPTYYGELAVDPSVIPLGSYVHIEGVGTFKALDTGGAVYGRHLDVLGYTWAQLYRIQGTGYRKAYWWPGPKHFSCH